MIAFLYFILENIVQFKTDYVKISNHDKSYNWGENKWE